MVLVTILFLMKSLITSILILLRMIVLYIFFFSNNATLVKVFPMSITNFNPKILIIKNMKLKCKTDLC